VYYARVQGFEDWKRKMFRKVIYLTILILILLVEGGVQASLEALSLPPTHDAHVGNDARLGPETNDGSGNTMYIRDTKSSRRVSFVSYNISGLQCEDSFFNEVRFSNYGYDRGTVLVYGVVEELDEIDEATITWNNAPGVKNDPAPPLGDPVALDHNDLTPLLFQFVSPRRGIRESTEPSRELADFLNSDTDGIVIFLFASTVGQKNGSVRTKELEDDVGGTFIEGLIDKPPRAIAINPANGEKGVPRDVVLSWAPLELSKTHDLYFGTDKDNVRTADRDNSLNVLLAHDLVASEYNPGRLKFGKTYYWRIDEVSADLMILKGFVWCFTVESYSIPIHGEVITVTAESYMLEQGPENTINSSGLNNNDQHSNDIKTMWLSEESESGLSWIWYDFDKIYKLHEMLVWNFNGEFLLNYFGMKDVTVEYSIDGINWMQISNVMEFIRAPGTDDYSSNITVDFDGFAAKHVRIIPNSNWSNGFFNQVGLSEVRFMQIPVYAGNPYPEVGAKDVPIDVTVSWKPGREAAVHNLHISSDMQSVIDGISPIVNVSQAECGPLSLNLGELYYWRVDEVNEAEIPAIWQGAIWSFSTVDYLVVDDFESYCENDSKRIFETWKDGLGDPLNGSVVVEESRVVRSGSRSMAFMFDNSNTEGRSEVSVKLSNLDIGRDWTRGAPEKLVFWIHGDPGNVSSERLYVKVNDTRCDCDINRDALIDESWIQVSVDLIPNSMNLTDVNEFKIGFIRDALTTGRGVVYIDDIRLYRHTPLPSEEKL